MINKILNLKHWQIFLLIFLLPMLIQQIYMGMAFSQLSETGYANPETILNNIKIIASVMVVFMYALFAWFWAIGVGLQKVIEHDLKLNTVKFKASLLYAVVYSLIFIIFFVKAFSITNINPKLLLVFFPMHLVAMASMFYCMYFVAKTLKTAELQKKVVFNDFITEFLMVWFYPIGVWVLQPQINKMVKKLTK